MDNNAKQQSLYVARKTIVADVIEVYNCYTIANKQAIKYKKNSSYIELTKTNTWLIFLV